MDIPRTDVYLNICDVCAGKGVLDYGNGDLYQCWLCQGSGQITKCIRCHQRLPCQCDHMAHQKQEEHNASITTN